MTFHEFTDFPAFAARAKKAGVEDNIQPLLTLPVMFLQRTSGYTLLTLKDYRFDANRIVFLSKGECLVYGEQPALPKELSKHKDVLKKPYGESTIVALLLMRKVLESYQTRFEEINKAIDETEETLDLYRAAEVWKKLRRTTDRMEDFVDLVIRLKDREILEVDTTLVSYDYDVLLSTAQHLLDRCKSHLIQLANLRNEFEVASTLTLSRNVEQLTKVTAFLAIVTLIISVPNTVATVFSIVPVGASTDLSTIWIILLFSTLVALGAGYYYWKTYKRRHGAAKKS